MVGGIEPGALEDDPGGGDRFFQETFSGIPGQVFNGSSVND